MPPTGQTQQIALRDEGWESPEEEALNGPGPRPTAEDMRILLWLKALRRPATHFQIGWRWGRFAGRDPASTYRALRRLTHNPKEPLLEERPLQEAFGNTSQKSVWFSRAGARFLGITGLKRLEYWRPQSLLEAIALTDFELETQSSGWVPIPEDLAYSALRQQQLARMRTQTLTDTENHIRDILSRAQARGEDPGTPFPAIQHTATGQVRLVYHARHGHSIVERLREMPDIRLFGAVEICILGDDADRVYQASDAVTYWAQRGRQTVAATRVANWRRRENPNRRLDVPTKRYGLMGTAEWDDPVWFAHPH